MSWITILWSMIGAACLTLAAFYCVVWLKQRENWVHLLFSSSAVAAAAIAGFELAMMHARTVKQYEALLRWIHVPTWALTLSLVGFVLLYLRAGRPWLAWTICGLRTVVLILNFIFTPNLNYRQITSVHQFSWGGDIISVPVGVANPWGLLSQVGLVLLLIFFIEATITVWRRGDRERALVVGGSMIFGAMLAWHVPFVIWGIIEIPFFLCFAYSGIVVAMAYELSNDMARAAELARRLRRSEATLRESKERIDLATKAAGLVVWTWDIPRDEVWLSDKDRALFGFSQGEKLNAERIRSVVHPEDRQLVRQLRENALRTGEEIETQYRVLLPDGKIRWVARRGRVECDADGKPFRERGVLMDITERKQAELEAAHQRNELVHLSRVTTLGELSSSLAHELTHPLTAILSNAQAAQRFLARDDADLDEVREILNDIVTEDQRAGEVIHRLRRLLKKGEPPKHCDDVDLNEVVRDVLKLMRNDLINQNVIVDTDLAQNLPAVTGDRVELQQVLLNLVLNACEAMADCGSSERQLLIASKLEKSAVHVSVTDRGGGIPEEKPEQVFERFFTTKNEGMGLGLSICRTIINAHRGEIWATNNSDCGATFHFSLPIIRSDALSAASPKVLDGLVITALDASSPRVAAPNALLRSAANGSEAEELTVSASSFLLEKGQ